MIRKVLGMGLAMIVFAATTISSKASGLQKLDASTFKSDYRITSVHIGSDVYEISDYTFRNLNNLKSITVSENNPYFASYSNCLYDKEMTELVCFPPALSGAIIPASVVTIRNNALHGVADDLRKQVRNVVEAQASGYLKESEVPGAHFIHTEYGVKWKEADGTVTSPYNNIMNLAGAVVSASSTGSMTQQQQLEAAFYYVAGNIYYARSTEEPSGQWVKEYAQNTLSEKIGNCYGYAAAFAYVAKGLGYDAKVCTGTVKSSLGGRTAHAWTEVKVAGKWYVFDTEMQNAKGSGYYKQTYDSYPAGPLEKEKEYKVSF
jgi:transglutaminase-like putative cysteine protease